MTKEPEPWLSEKLITHAVRIAMSYLLYTGESLVQAVQPEGVAEELYHADFVQLCHDTQEDPIFNYGNLQAQALWQISWDQLMQMPSRKSAEPVEREVRQAMLARAREKGFIDNYHGIRIDASGKRFEIKQAQIWNVFDEEGQYVGQAAKFHQWEYMED